MLTAVYESLDDEGNAANRAVGGQCKKTSGGTEGDDG